jgi:tetratricopeptide (TPR) repeat protein
MTNKTKVVLQNRASAPNFLYSKTDTGRITGIGEREVVGVNEVLQSEFPDMLTGMDFIDHVGQCLESVEKFTTLAIEVDQARQEEDRYSIPGTPDEHVEVAGILETICRENNGFWGTLEAGLFGGILPDTNGSEGLKIARDFQNRLAEKAEQTVTIGIASFPIITFKKSDMINNARKALEHAAFFGPGSAVAFDGVSLNISGDKLYENGDLMEAVEEFKRALLVDPSNVNVHNSLGVCYGLQGEYDSAIEEFNAAAAIDPSEYMAMFNLGLVHTLKNQAEKALEFFLSADKIKADVYEVIFQSGKLYFESGDLEKAQSFLERAVKLDPNSGAVYQYLGECYAADNLMQDAISAYKKAIRHNPHDAASMSALGCLLDNQGENPEITLMFCRESVGLSPENGLFRYRLGKLYFKQNLFDDALKEYKKASQFGYDATQDIQKAENRLNESKAMRN